ncbi:MAG TPA: hypothetical protein VF230_05595 [Acidimicrobiales bacterium]
MPEAETVPGLSQDPDARFRMPDVPEPADAPEPVAPVAAAAEAPAGEPEAYEARADIRTAPPAGQMRRAVPPAASPYPYSPYSPPHPASPLPPPAPAAAAEASPTTDEAPTGPPTIDEIRSRLAARGLLATAPRIVVPKEPRADREESATPESQARPGDAFDPVLDDEAQWADTGEDDWDVDPGTTETTVRCPQCREVFFRPLDATRFACPTCERAWRFAICEGCDELALTIERQESWRCGSCGHFTRSWWRTVIAQKTAFDVVARRKHLLVEHERRLVREGMKKRRWKLIALAVWSMVVALGIVIGVRMSEPSAATGTATACAHFDRLRGDIVNGTISAQELEKELDAMQVEAEGGDERVLEAVIGFRSSGRNGTSSFLVARTALADACELATRR